MGVFKKSTLDRDLFSVERFAFYLVGVYSLKFNITNPEFGCRHCRPFLKKGSAKNFPTGKVLGYFSKIVRSTVVSNRRAFFITPSGYAETILISQTSSLAVGTADSGYAVTILIPQSPTA